MTWTRLSDNFNDRPELLALSRGARLLHVEALVYSNRLLTDGQIPRAALPRFSDTPRPDADVTELVDAGLWVSTDVPPGWQIQGWADLHGEAQEPSGTVKRRRDEATKRQTRRRKHADGDHSDCVQPYCSEAAPRDTQSDERRASRRDTQSDERRASQHPVPSRPDPARPGPKEPGRGLRCPHGRPMGVDGTGCEHCAADASAQQKRASS